MRAGCEYRAAEDSRSNSLTHGKCFGSKRRVHALRNPRPQERSIPSEAPAQALPGEGARGRVLQHRAVLGAQPAASRIRSRGDARRPFPCPDRRRSPAGGAGRAVTASLQRNDLRRADHFLDDCGQKYWEEHLRAGSGYRNRNRLFDSGRQADLRVCVGLRKERSRGLRVAVELLGEAPGLHVQRSNAARLGKRDRQGERAQRFIRVRRGPQPEGRNQHRCRRHAGRPRISRSCESAVLLRQRLRGEIDRPGRRRQLRVATEPRGRRDDRRPGGGRLEPRSLRSVRTELSAQLARILRCRRLRRYEQHVSAAVRI